MQRPVHTKKCLSLHPTPKMALPYSMCLPTYSGPLHIYGGSLHTYSIALPTYSGLPPRTVALSTSTVRFPPGTVAVSTSAVHLSPPTVALSMSVPLYACSGLQWPAVLSAYR